MKNLLFTLLFLFTASFSLQAQYSYTVKGHINNPTAGQFVNISYSSIYCGNYYGTAYTDTLGNYSYTFSLSSSCKAGHFILKMLDCNNDTLYQYDYTDSLYPNPDTLVHNFKYCDTCRQVSANFGYNHYGVNYDFEGLAYHANKYYWSFGDTTYSTLIKPHKVYIHSGTYNVCLVAQDTSLGCSDTICKNITVDACDGFYANPYASSVTGKTVNFLGLGSVNANKWYWDFGDTTNSTSKNPTHVYSNYGTYNVCLIAQDTINGCADTTCISVNVPNACSGFTANFTDSVSIKTAFLKNTSTSSSNKWTWYFGDSTTSTQKNPSHTYSNYGTYTVCLVARDTTKGCVDSICKSVVLPNLCAGFTANFSDSVSIKTAFLKNTSSSNGNKWSWTFGDATGSQLKNPNHTYSAYGTYNVCLVARDTIYGCKDSICKNVVLPNLCTGFTANFTDSTSGKTAFFKNTSSSNGNKWSWTFGDTTGSTQKNPTHTYNNFTTYNVCLIARDTILGCADTVCKNITLYPCVGFTASFHDSIFGDSAGFFNLSSSNSNKWTWDFGDSTGSNQMHPGHMYSSAGTRTVCLIAQDTINGCADTMCKSVTVHPCIGFFVYPSVDSINHLNKKVYFKSYGSSTANKWLWLFGDTTTSTLKNPVHTYPNFGTYTVCLVGQDTINGCVDTTCSMISIINPCTGFTANFTFTTSGKTVILNNTSSGGANKWKWSFGDTSSGSIAKNPTHTYAGYGPYTVCLVAYDTLKGCVDSICKSVTFVNPCSGFVANFTTSLSSKTVTFTNTSSSSANKWSWKFGDGATSTVKSPTPHIYPAYDSTYQVCLVVKDTIKGCADSICKNVVIPYNCASQFTVNFTDSFVNLDHFFTASVPAGANKFVWKFGDGDSSTAKNPAHTFAATGTYMVCLTAWDTVKGCTKTVCKSTLVSYKCSGFYAGLGIMPNGLNPNFLGSAPSWANAFSWNFGDSTTSTLQSPAHTYSSPGTRTVCFKATDTITGCKDSSCTSISVHDCSGFAATYTSTFVNDTARFTASATGGYGTLNYYWTFGDGGTAVSTATPKHKYASYGAYNVCLYVSTAYGCYDTICNSITYAPNCSTFHANYSYYKSDLTANFTNSSSSTADVYQWNFGDGNTSTSKNPSHAFASPGTYSVCMRATDTATGCTDSICKSVVIVGCSGFQASFTFTDSCQTIKFTNTSSSSTTNSYWQFGDGQWDSTKNPQHTYIVPGNYNACLVAYDADNGCFDTACTSNVNIDASLHGYIYRDSSQYADSGIVYLIKVTIDTVAHDTILTAVDSAYFYSPAGYYEFNPVPVGIYLIKAALLPGAAFYSNRIPTYYMQSPVWRNANYKWVDHACLDADIILETGSNPGGSAFIGGSVLTGANKVGDPLEQLEVLLLNADNTPFGYTYTDANGQYQFDNIAYGSYRVIVEIPGKPCEEFNAVVDAVNPSVTNVDFEVNTKNITLKKTTTGMAEMGKGNLLLYPNPATSVLNVMFDAAAAGSASISISDLSGRQVLTTEHEANIGRNKVEMDVNNLSYGFYIISIKTGNNVYVGKLSINK